MTPDHAISAVGKAVTLMGEKLNESAVPTLQELAEAAGISKYHFHRIYRLITGETCSRTLHRLRLSRASVALAAGDNVTESAFLAGYSSSQALAKALRKTLDVSATELQACPDRVAATLVQLGRVRDASGALISVEVAAMDPFEVVAIRTHGQYEQLASTYESLASVLGGMENIRGIFGITMNDAEEGFSGALTFDCAFEPQVMPDELSIDDSSAFRTTIDGGVFLVGRHHGCFSQLGETLDALYWRLLDAEQWQPADRPVFMHYLDDPSHTEVNDLRTDIHIPVERA
ncbi:MAG: GyrI-like domain-containing protein [Wenzhouxiangella sp.]|jgi:AraC family transcriptional regulator|nr:GyrI-like domain-containing protein [Wenzhouxiangella sp.]